MQATALSSESLLLMERIVPRCRTAHSIKRNRLPVLKEAESSLWKKNQRPGSSFFIKHFKQTISHVKQPIPSIHPQQTPIRYTNTIFEAKPSSSRSFIIQNARVFSGNHIQVSNKPENSETEYTFFNAGQFFRLVQIDANLISKPEIYRRTQLYTLMYPNIVGFKNIKIEFNEAICRYFTRNKIALLIELNEDIKKDYQKYGGVTSSCYEDEWWALSH